MIPIYFKHFQARKDGHSLTFDFEKIVPPLTGSFSSLTDSPSRRDSIARIAMMVNRDPQSDSTVIDEKYETLPILRTVACS